MRIRLKIEEARRQASWRFSFASKLVKVGIKADPSAPPATRVNRVSGIRFAVIKASMASEVPKALATRICLSKPVKLLITKADVTRLAARAIWRLAERESWGRDSLFTIKDYIISYSSKNTPFPNPGSKENYLSVCYNRSRN